MAVPRDRLIWFSWAAFLLTGGAVLRFAQIPERALHSDEAVQAFQTWRLLGDGVYDYSPEDRHGPVLYLLSAAAVTLGGVDADTLSALHLRLFSALCGLALIAAVLGWGAWRRDWAWLLGGGLIAIAPFVVCYQDFYIQESLFASLSIALAWGVAISRDRLSLSGAIALGACAGTLLATKETAVLHFGALALAWGLTVPRGSATGCWNPPRVAAATAAAVLVWLLWMTQGLRRWDGLGEGLSAFFHYISRAGGAGHAKPFAYYFSLFWPQLRGGVWWSQVGLLGAGLAGGVVAWLRRGEGVGARRWALLAVFAWALWWLHSVIPYKTPWLVLTPTIGFCLLAGYLLSAIGHLRLRVGGWVVSLVLGGLLVGEAVRGWNPALFRYADDERNPYLYSHTNPGFRRLLNRLDDIYRVEPEATLAVVQPEYAWPLPWHLRHRERVGYFSTPPETLAQYDCVVIDARLVGAETPPELDGFVVEAHGLRTNVLLFLYVREAIWEALLAASDHPA